MQNHFPSLVSVLVIRIDSNFTRRYQFNNITMYLRTKLAAVAGSAIVGSTYLYNNDSLKARNFHSNAHMKYPASANYPDLSQHHNMLKDFLTPGVSYCFVHYLLSSFIHGICYKIISMVNLYFRSINCGFVYN